MISRFSAVGAATLALLAFSGTARADITIYTSLSEYLAAVSAPGTDTFAGMSITGPTTPPVTRAAGTYTYTASVLNTSNSTQAHNLWAGGTTADPFLSTAISGDTISLGSFSAGVMAAGGNFFASDTNGAYSAGSVTVTVTDASGTISQIVTPTSMTAGSFLGFVSTTGVTSLTIKSNITTVGIWPSVDNLVLANAVTAVPEPSSYAMLLTGLALAGAVIRRRRTSQL